tara:strand:+ start:118 stop:2160 length:2043 start_codon:yes stop_codon:yes gene_type:complete
METKTTTKTTIKTSTKTSTKKSTMTFLKREKNYDWDKINKDFKLEYIKTKTKSQVRDIIKIADYHFHNNKSVISDLMYDEIKEYYENKYNTKIEGVGADITFDKKKVKLPIYMGSMRKMKPDDDLVSWSKKYTDESDCGHIISDKLDGTSVLFVYTKTNKIRLFTRGNGKYGQDISYLQDYINIPKLYNNKKIKQQIIVRGELIVKRKTWEKYKHLYKNARNFVSGLVNSKKISTDKLEYIKDISFVAYELINPVTYPKQQFEIIEKLGFEVVFNKFVKTINNSVCSELLTKRREESLYEIDGIIITVNKIFPREVDANPKHSIAFKMVISDNIMETIVLDIEWNLSNWGVYKPRIKIKPIKLEGTTINWVTGNNARYILHNDIGGLIGPGSVVHVIRSGQVIPKIIKVVTPAKKAKMPLKYKWNKTKVDILTIEDTKNKTIQTKNILRFIEKLGIESIKIGNINKLYDAGIDTIPKLLTAKESDFLKVEGIKEKLANKMFINIKNSYESATLIQLMDGSSCFGSGFGSKRFRKIIEIYPNILELVEKDKDIVNKLKDIDGFSDKTVIQFMSGIKLFREFLKLLPKKTLKSEQHKGHPTQIENKQISDSMKGFNILFSGHRDKKLIQYILERGGNIESSFSNSITHVVTKDKTIKSGKIKKAIKKNINIYNIEEFINTYV